MKSLPIASLALVLALSGCASSPSIEEQTKLIEYEKCLELASITITEIRRTVFAHEIPQNAAVMPDEADGRWKFIDGAWVEPVIYIEPAPQAMIESPQVVEEQNVEETPAEEATN